MKSQTRRPSASLVISFIALAVAITGTATALPGKNTVDSGDIKKKAVTTKKIRKGAVTEPKIAKNAVTTGKIAGNAVNDRKISDYELVGGSYVLVNATNGATAAAARTSAPETELFSKGQARIYAKCFRDTGTDTTFAEVYAQTSANGAVMEGEDDHPGGNAAANFLNTNTLEVDRVLAQETATGNDAGYNEAEWALAFPDGTGLTGQDVVGAKNGNLAGGNGLYGSGNVCLFQGSILG